MKIDYENKINEIKNDLIYDIKETLLSMNRTSFYFGEYGWYDCIFTIIGIDINNENKLKVTLENIETNENAYNDIYTLSIEQLYWIFKQIQK
jgi:hypothetical protein